MIEGEWTKNRVAGKFLAISAFLIMAFLSSALTPSARAQPLHFTCTFSKASFATLDNKRKVEITLNSQKPMEVTFEDLDTDTPKLSFASGEFYTQGGRVDVIRREVGLIWMAQSPEQGSVNYWTIFLKQKTALLTRHFAQDVTSLQRPVGEMSMGRCK